MLIKRTVINCLLSACSACASTSSHHGYFHGITPDQVSVRYCPGDGITLLCKWGK